MFFVHALLHVASHITKGYFTGIRAHSKGKMWNGTISPPGGEKLEQRMLAYESEQPIAGCLAIIHNIAAI